MEILFYFIAFQQYLGSASQLWAAKEFWSMSAERRLVELSVTGFKEFEYSSTSLHQRLRSVKISAVKTGARKLLREKRVGLKL